MKTVDTVVEVGGCQAWGLFPIPGWLARFSFPRFDTLLVHFWWLFFSPFLLFMYLTLHLHDGNTYILFV